MNIRPSAAIRQNYNEIADLCRKSAEPVYLTKNGEGDLVVMDIDYYERTMRKIYEAKAIIEGLEDIKAGRTIDGNTAISNIRGKYGI